MSFRMISPARVPAGMVTATGTCGITGANEELAAAEAANNGGEGHVWLYGLISLTIAPRETNTFRALNCLRKKSPGRRRQASASPDHPNKSARTTYSLFGIIWQCPLSLHRVKAIAMPRTVDPSFCRGIGSCCCN